MILSVGPLRVSWGESGRRRRSPPTLARRSAAYAAAESSLLTSGWDSEPKTPDEEIETTLRRLRARSRERVRNHCYARRFQIMLKTNTVGPQGIQIQVQSTFPDGRLDDALNSVVEAAWRDWSRPENCDVAERYSWRQMQELWITTIARDGECLARLYPDRGPYGLQLQLIDPEMLPVDYNVDALPGGGAIRMGIEIDSVGKPVAYHLRKAAATDRYYTISIAPYERIPARWILHGFVPDAIGQRRGIPWYAAALNEMRHLGGYTEAAVIAARVGAAKGGWLKPTETGEGFVGEDEDEEKRPIIEAEPGTLGELPQGFDVVQFTPEYPRGEFPEFVKAMLRGIASALGVSYTSLANDLENVNYSSARVGVLDERAVFEGLQNSIVEGLCRPVYERWLEIVLLGGLIRIGTERIPIERWQKLRNVSWQGRRWPWVDPLKDAQAATVDIEQGIRSRSEAIRERGRDPDEVWREIAKERDQLQELGLKFPILPGG
ncbi:MAG: phage portal protein [Elusimicrobia bacterium RBG_16_66_12]|nr:MAG: phage portal protein [Elusimicrobia bacterium RBG_16_66_12]